MNKKLNHLLTKAGITPDEIGMLSQFHTTKRRTTERKHEEADLHLSFCKWVRLQYPKLDFIRHEREKARSFMMQNLFKVYNSANDKMPDFELLHPSGKYHRLYIEFKKPGTKVTKLDGYIKKEYVEQYLRHRKFWEQGSPAYFCSDLHMAQIYLVRYLEENPIEMQEYLY